MGDSGRNGLADPSATIEMTDIAVGRLFDNVAWDSAKDDVYLDAVKEPDGNIFYERKIKKK